MFAGLALWVVAFYLPYAWFTLTFNYSYGQATCPFLLLF